MSKALTLVALLILSSSTTMAYEQMFPKTSPGVIEIKTLPAMRALKHQGDKSYFKASNGLFMPLFRYIQKNNLAMTTPVESEMNPATMMFFVGSDVDVNKITSTDKVEIVSLPERQVLAVGIRGSYSEKNYQQAEAQALKWLEENLSYLPNGPSRMIYWNGPYVPGPLKKSELHLPVKKQD